MKKFIIVLLSYILLTGCNSSTNYDNPTYNITANEYSSFAEIPMHELSPEPLSSSISIIDIYNNSDLSTEYYMVDYCLYEDSVIAIFTNGCNCLIYNIGTDFSKKMFDYPVDESVSINDMCYANDSVYWLETSYKTGNSIKKFNTVANKIETIAVETETTSFSRIYSDGQNMYCSRINKDTQIWDICYYTNNHLKEYKEDIYVTNPYNPFFISDGYVQYLLKSNDTLSLQVENINDKSVTTLNLGVKPDEIGINTIACNEDFIAWRDIKNMTDYSSVSTVIYNTSTGEINSQMVTNSPKNTSSLTSGIIRNKLFVHYSSDGNGYSNIYIYNLLDKITYNLTCNVSENVTFSYPKITNNKLIFVKKENSLPVSIQIYEII